MKAIYIILICIFMSFNLAATEQWTHSIYTGSNQLITRENDFIWAGCVSVVLKWNIDDGSSIKYTNVDGLAKNCVKAIAIDAEGNKWFGTEGGGVTKFDEFKK